MTDRDDRPELKGIVASDEFRRYIADFRQTWKDLHVDHGFPQPENRGLTLSKMSSKPTSDSIDRRMMTRRGAMRAGAGAAVTLATLSAGAGNVSAVSGLDAEGDYVQAPFVKAAVTVALHTTDIIRSVTGAHIPVNQ